MAIVEQSLRGEIMAIFLLKLLRSESGSTAVEYGFLIALIFLAIASAVAQFADTNQTTWNLVATKMAQN